MNSVIALRWNQGGRNVCSATSQRGGNTTKSTLAVPGRRLGEVRTVLIEGSAWSKETVLIAMKRAMSYLYGVRLPCHATTSSGLCGSFIDHSLPRNLTITSVGRSGSSKAATGAWKSRALARPLDP